MTIEGTINDAAEAYLDTVYTSAHQNAPKTLPEALTGPDRERWLKAFTREYEQHVKLKTMGPPVDVKDLPAGVKPIPFDLILKVKRDGLFKIRGIIKGFRMTMGIDYNETFSPIPNLTTLRLLLAITAKHDWECKQGDAPTAFLGPCLLYTSDAADE